MSDLSTPNYFLARQNALTCKICSRTFGRQEHLQRHARTHTKEKPYVCHCGRSFTRKDLLTRHERLNHAASERTNHPAASALSPVASGHELGIAADGQSASGILQESDDIGIIQRAAPQSLDTAGEPELADPLFSASLDSFLDGNDDPILEFSRFMNSAELNVDWDAMLADPLPALPIAHTESNAVQQVTPDSTDLSRVPDDPSGDDDFQELKPLSCPWLMREPQLCQLKESLSPFQHVIPHFWLPTRLSIARYMSGYVDGFSNHNPFIHIPTLKVLSYPRSPELVLGIMAIGAQYRYETKTARSLYEASRSIILERLRRGDLFPPTKAKNIVQYESDTQPINADYMDRARALLILASYCSWQADLGLTNEGFEYQSLIARSLRQIGLSESQRSDGNDWSQWARCETDRRTKFFGWCLLNLQSLAFNTPPLLLAHEVNLYLPSTCEEWVAPNQAKWLAARSRFPSPVMFKDAHSSHVASINDLAPVPGVSPMGNYILIHAVLQRIYLSQQLSHDSHRQSLSAQAVEEFEQALNRWRHTWRTSPESMLDLQNSYASLSFTSTALLGAAHIRLHCNMGQWRDLSSCDTATVAAALKKAPAPTRGGHLIFALLHSVHSLNIPVQLGITYLSRCRSFSWSIHHALCDMECSAFLSKWFEVIADTHDREPLSPLEYRVIRWVMRVVREALLSHDDMIHLGYQITDYDLTQLSETARLLSYAVVKVWAHMFKFCNSPWPVVRFIGQSLDRYAGLVRTTQVVD